MDDGVAGVVTALAAHHDVGLGGQDVDDFSLPFIAPLRADQDCVRHKRRRQKNFPMHPARRNRDLPTNDRKDAGRCKSF